MGSYGRSDVADESLRGFSTPGSDCLMQVEGDLGKYSDNSGIGLFDKSRDCEVCDDVVLERNPPSEVAPQLVDCSEDAVDNLFIEKSCLDVVLEHNLPYEAAPQLVDCSGDDADQLFPEKESCLGVVIERNLPSEESSPLVDCSGDAVDHPFLEVSCLETACFLSRNIDQPYVFPSQKFSTMDLGIDQEVTVVGRDQPENGHENTALLVSEQLPNIEFGVSGFCSDERDKHDQIGYSRCIEETHLVNEGAQYGMGNRAQTGEIPSISSPLTTSPSKYTQPEQKDTKNVVGLSEETDTDFLGGADEKHVLAGTLSRSKTQKPDIEENSCKLIGGTPNIASDCAIAVFDSLQLSHLSGVEDANSYRHLTSDDQEIDDLGGASFRSDLVDSTGLPDNEIKDTGKLNFISIYASADIICSSPRRSTRRSKSKQMTETRKTSRRCRKTAGNTFLPGGIIGISLKIAKMKRSCPCKRARFSVWGALENIIRIFTQYDGIQQNDTQLVQVENHASHRRKGGHGSKRQQKIQAGGTLTPRRKSSASTSRIRLKVKMGGEVAQRSLKVVLSDVVDSPVPAPTVVSECALEPDCQIGVVISELANGTLHKLEEHVHDTQFVYHGGDLEKPVASLGARVLDSRYGDKDLESSVTQETSVGNTSGGFPGVFSQVGSEALEEAVINRYSDPGTSPDSEVINLIQDVGTGARVQEDLHDVLLTPPQSVVDPLDATSINVKLTSSKKGKENGNIKGISYPSAGCFAAEEKLSGEGSQNKSRKSSKRRPGKRVGGGCNTINASVLTTGNGSSVPSSIERYPNESFLDSGMVKPGEMSKVETVTKNGELSGQDIGIKLSESLAPEGLLDTGKSVGLKLPKGSKSNVKVSKRRSRASDSARCRKGKAHEQKKKGVQKSANKSKVKQKGCLGQVINNGENHLESGGDVNICSGTRKLSEVREPGINVPGHDICDDLGKFNTGNKIASEDIFQSSVISSGLDEQFLPPRNAWVRCDDCYKWRCISAALADSIEETNRRWTCKENIDKAFADCSIPQEKTNAEINAELEISDASCEEDASDAYPNSKGFERNQSAVSQRAPWKLIKSNLFLHRSRKTQTIDEIMVCHCKLPLDGSLRCGDECLNRMLNIECVRGTCPCGDLCSNQQFQKRKYAKLKWFRCGKKGYGLQLLENVSRGKFLIEYVGEVLDLHAYEARQREYASRGQKHFYFMTLNGNEVIDACVKGNLGRFINHSCDPNCRTEKWMVNGEVCIGLFALRDIKKGEEVTFDYNYVRVFGAAAKKCVCGSSECRGYIGGDPLNTEAVVQGDSDEEYPEPVMVHEDEDGEDGLDKMISNGGLTDTASVQHAKIFLRTTDATIKSPSASRQETSSEKEDSMSRSVSFVQPLEIYSPMEDTMRKSVSAIQSPEISLQTEDVMNKSSSAVQSLEISLGMEDTMNKTLSTIQSLETSSPISNNMSKSLSDSVAAKSKTISNTVEDKPNISKARAVMKSSRSSSSIKKVKCSSYSVVANKPQVLANKPKKMLEGATGSRLEGVEEKLNEVLDANGGISKRKDATKGYLKLLFVTAASGDNVNGEAVQSTRDLSIILDALLKTKSRMVLVDIINKNGLQMLHNIMKQNRRNFNKTPIIRKLLKVLEFLALREILTLEHINSSPPCAGIESFKESIIKLTRHNDIQVHQIARNFRDKWFPRTARKISYSDRDDIKLESGPNCNWSLPKRRRDQDVRPTDAIDCVRQAVLALVDTNNQQSSSGPSLAGCATNGTKTRKRKSRWDQPAGKSPDRQSPELVGDQKRKHKLDTNPQQPKIREVVRDEVSEVKKENICNGCDCSLSRQAEIGASVDAMLCIHEDAPPGFPSLLNSPSVPSDAVATTSVNLPPQNIHHRSSSEVVTGCLQGRYLSHLPVSYGIPLSFVEQLGTPQEETVDSWFVAPAIPFHPFPPLPSFPRDKCNGFPPSSAVMTNGPGEEVQRDSCCLSPHEGDPSTPSTSGSRPADRPPSGANNQHMVERMRSSSAGMGRRSFRQQKWSNWKCGPPWFRRRNGSGFRANNSRSGVCSVVLGNVDNEMGSFCCSED